MFSQGGDNKTYYMGRSNNRVKIYNKKLESNLDRELTRIEITSTLDLNIKDYEMYHYNVPLPRLYLNNYLLTFDDIEDKTLLAIIYAIQNGFPLNDLSRRYKDKVEKRLMQRWPINTIFKQYVYTSYKTMYSWHILSRTYKRELLALSFFILHILLYLQFCILKFYIFYLIPAYLHIHCLPFLLSCLNCILLHFVNLFFSCFYLLKFSKVCYI